MSDGCKCEGERIVRWDHTCCGKCGSVRTDVGASWGIAKQKWFASFDEAKFYRDHGRLPEASRCSGDRTGDQIGER